MRHPRHPVTHQGWVTLKIYLHNSRTHDRLILMLAARTSNRKPRGSTPRGPTLTF
jgi:hypothetical protein